MTRRKPLICYKAPAWLPDAHSQTIYPFLRRGNAPRYRRERWETPDGDFIDLDWIDGPVDAPLMVLFHGLEGSSSSHYACAFARAAHARDWRFVVPHFRGCSGEPNLLPRAYHSGDHEEVAWILERLRGGERQPLFAVGISLGGSALLNWVGRAGASAANTVRACAGVCAPLDLAAAGRSLELGFNRVYTGHFLVTLKRNAIAKLTRFPGLFDAQAVRRARTLWEFDEVVTAPLHGFAGADDYWERASSGPWLASVAIPTLVINARNDPFLPASALPSRDQVSPSVTLEYPDSGGHVGFVSGWFPGHIDWLPSRILAFFEDTTAAGRRGGGAGVTDSPGKAARPMG